MDNKLKIETTAFVLLIVAFPVVSVGAAHGQEVVWWIGLIALVIGGLLPIWTRFMDHSNDKPRDVGMEFDDRVS